MVHHVLWNIPNMISVSPTIFAVCPISFQIMFFSVTVAQYSSQILFPMINSLFAPDANFGTPLHLPLAILRFFFVFVNEISAPYSLQRFYIPFEAPLSFFNRHCWSSARSDGSHLLHYRVFHNIWSNFHNPSQNWWSKMAPEAGESSCEQSRLYLLLHVIRHRLVEKFKNSRFIKFSQ